ncbi:MAG: hypothetical protein HKN32_06165 [Flavobacteriales bacterium]|nr:hypothetical protein [Flavobacteriales bacterium]
MLKEQLDDRAQQLDVLLHELAEKDIQIANLEQVQNDLLCTMKLLNDSINEVYFAFGTFKELKENQVVERDGGLFGFLGAKALKDDFNTDYFYAADLRYLQEIPLRVEKAELVTNHPTDSYVMIGDEGVEKIKITNPEAFWSQSRYLAIEVKM